MNFQVKGIVIQFSIVRNKSEGFLSQRSLRVEHFELYRKKCFVKLEEAPKFISKMADSFTVVLNRPKTLIW